MSADSYALCPRCSEAWHADVELKQQRVEQAYGNVPADEYMQLLREADAVKPLDYTLAEYVIIGVEGIAGAFVVAYRCACDKCGYEFKYKHEEKLKW